MAREKPALEAIGMATVLELDRALAATLRAPQYGWRNPQLVRNDFWTLMVRVRRTAQWAADVFRMKVDPCTAFGTSARRELPDGPIFCFTRSGRSVTHLPDGRLVYVGGEHEDWYDPNFCIYNDVVVESPDGSIDIYAYPLADFPPTDFHTATLVGDQIYLIGSLGYTDQRVIGTTPVYILDTLDLSIAQMSTEGESPGRIYGHVAEYDRVRHAIRIEGGKIATAEGTQPNTGIFFLDLASNAWETAT